MSLSALGALFSAMFEPLEGAGAPRETADVSRTRERSPGCWNTEQGGFSRLLAQRSLFGTFREVCRSNGPARSFAMMGERTKRESDGPAVLVYDLDNTSTETRKGVCWFILLRTGRAAALHRWECGPLHQHGNRNLEAATANFSGEVYRYR